jgi:hypothetical protein
VREGAALEEKKKRKLARVDRKMKDERRRRRQKSKKKKTINDHQPKIPRHRTTTKTGKRENGT